MRNTAIRAGNPLKLGVFGSNCANGLAFTQLPERWQATWNNNVALAKLADGAGFECLVPVSRWKGFGGATNVAGVNFETITWACGLLAETKRINIFGTVHAPMIHPVVGAKQMVTADHIGRGRFGINIVCGWNLDEFEMFGIQAYEHDMRYEYAEEWWQIVKRIWSCPSPEDFKGKFFHLRDLEAGPGPYGDGDPMMMNAGASTAGRAFAVRHSDLHLDYCRTPAESTERIHETKAMARSLGRQIQVWIPASIVCRPTQKEADEYAQRCIENADWEALDHQFALYTGTYGSRSRSAEQTRLDRTINQTRAVLSYGGSYSIRGDSDYVANELKTLHEAGFDGVAMGFVNYLDEVPYFIQEVIPRLEKMELRTALH
jgi:alkanesulfonate monooxygenase SsuD/methylene tetrahydromethanopterin reductase-like flavin-dependent oxidoreductase (luciferase family)